MKSNPLSIRTIMLGGGGTGKSALTIRFMYDEFLDEYDPTKLDAYKKKHIFEKQEISVHIADTAGQEDYNAMNESHYPSGDGFMLVFSVQDEDSFKAIDYIHNELCVAKSPKDPLIVLVGNKIDLPNRVVESDAIKQKAELWKVPWFETSAKTGENVEKAYGTLIGNCVRTKMVPLQNSVEVVNNKSSGCCHLV